MSLESYRGGFNVGAGFKPDGDSGFPLMESCDILTREDGTRLDAELISLWQSINNGLGSGDGVGIASISDPVSSGLVDTYTITLTNGKTYTFTVTNGKDGVDGTNGKDGQDGSNIKSIAKSDSNGLVDTYTVTLTDGSTSTFSVTNGNVTITDENGDYDISDVVDLVIARLPQAEEALF